MEDVKFLQEIVRNLSQPGIFVDSERTIRDCNDAIAGLFGYSREELLGKRTDLLYGDRRKDSQNKHEIYDVLEADGHHTGNAWGIKKSGDTMPLSLYTFVIKKDTGAIIMITESGRSAAEPAEDTRQLLQDLLDNIPDMIYFKDMYNRFVMVNKAHAAALRLTPEDIIAKTDLDLFPKELAEKYFADDTYVTNTGKPILDKIEKSARPDGGFTYVSTTKVPRYDPHGRITGTIGITRDVTERLTAQEELKSYKDHLEELVSERTKELAKVSADLQKMYDLKSEFTSMASHELRTPLSAIKDSIGIVKDRVAGPLSSRQEHFLAIALENIDRMARLINDFLDFSKLENKKVEYKITSGNINELAGSIVESYKPALSGKPVKLLKELDPSLPPVGFDADRITQVIHNMVNNAVKFTEKGYIKVTTMRSAGAVVVSVEDTGCGIAKENLRKVFHKFEQIPSDGAKKIPGTGLGLAICKLIVEQSGGRIWVESEYGKGSKFLFSLPIR